MAPTYRADSLAQVIEEGVRIFGPEVTAAALLAAVAAAPVRSTTQRAAPSIASKFCPSHSFRRKLWTTLAVVAFAVLAGAVVFGGGRESRDEAAWLIAPVNAASSSATPVSDKSFRRHLSLRRRPNPNGDAEAVAAPAVPETGTSPPESQHATDATTTTPATAEPTGQPTSTLKERRRASPERASRDDRRSAPRRVGFADAYPAETTKTKKATTVAQTQNAPAPAKDPNCNVFLPDNVFMSHHDQFRCFR